MSNNAFKTSEYLREYANNIPKNLHAGAIQHLTSLLTMNLTPLRAAAIRLAFLSASESAAYDQEFRAGVRNTLISAWYEEEKTDIFTVNEAVYDTVFNAAADYLMDASLTLADLVGIVLYVLIPEDAEAEKALRIALHAAMRVKMQTQQCSNDSIVA